MHTTPLPNNPEAERYVCALQFFYPSAEAELKARGFQAEWFYSPANRFLWAEMIEYRSKMPAAREIDSVSLLSQLVPRPDTIREIGGPAAITEIASIPAMLSPESLDFHVALLRQAWLRRRSIFIGERLAATARESDAIDETLAGTINELGALSRGAAGSRLINGKDALNEFLADLEAQAEGRATEQKPVLKTLMPEIDEKVGGLVPYFWLIGAETSGGKTALALQFARAALSQGGRVLVFALEMNARQLIRRLVSAEGKIPMQRLMRPTKMVAYDFAALTSRGTDWNAQNLLICDDGDVTIQEVRAIARAEHAREPLAMVILDYIQLASAGKFRDGSNREQEVSFIGVQCQKMAKELGIPVIAPTQLNDDRKVRESRALKQHAAVYLVIDKGLIGCSKCRDGERDWEIPYALTGDIQTFERRSAA